ncbi:Hypothetical protein AA314_00215 [Archangium gephyra]|uniref:Uncharacterized protein n=1 Tax=Archangium gephyra TaxID=48 RepID=A0AAC8Q070_9BACT|nr:Hypothetical protein AA314_00215 [Archangium gephyra]
MISNPKPFPPISDIKMAVRAEIGVSMEPETNRESLVCNLKV